MESLLTCCIPYSKIYFSHQYLASKSGGLGLSCCSGMSSEARVLISILFLMVMSRCFTSRHFMCIPGRKKERDNGEVQKLFPLQVLPSYWRRDLFCFILLISTISHDQILMQRCLGIQVFCFLASTVEGEKDWMGLVSQVKIIITENMASLQNHQRLESQARSLSAPVLVWADHLQSTFKPYPWTLIPPQSYFCILIKDSKSLDEPGSHFHVVIYGKGREYGLLLGFRNGQRGSLPTTHLVIPPNREDATMLCSQKWQIVTIPLFYRWRTQSSEGGKSSVYTTEWVKGNGRILSYPDAPKLLGPREAAPLRVFSESLTFPMLREGCLWRQSLLFPAVCG